LSQRTHTKDLLCLPESDGIDLLGLFFDIERQRRRFLRNILPSARRSLDRNAGAILSARGLLERLGKTHNLPWVPRILPAALHKSGFLGGPRRVLLADPNH